MKIKLKRGLEANTPPLDVGEPGFTTDSKKLFIGSDAGNIEIGGAGLLLKENKSEKGIANGYASLDSGAKIPSSQLPDSILGQLEYKGTFNPSSGYPASPEKGWYYISIGNAAISGVDYKVGDWAVYNGASWDKIDNTDTTALVEVTWQELKNKRDADELIPSQQYRITDYVTTTHQEFTRSAGHQFDIIITADSADKLNENARACLHAGDTYFANSKLEVWKLKYCLDNDTDRFGWANSVSGKGVIYRMIDEFNNDCPYDFKNIQFKRKLTDGQLDLDSGIDTWVYTFAISDMFNVRLVDLSLKQNTEYPDDEGQYRQCSNNVIKEATLDYQPDGLSRIQLNDNVFLNMFDNNESYGYYGCTSNTFGIGCFSNTFGHSCISNTFGDRCSSNIFSFGCSFNTFGDWCSVNTFGNSCTSNTFGHNCNTNTFGSNCGYNTFGKNCSSNTFGVLFAYNIFGYGCGYNTFGYGCYSNTFGDLCSFNTFGSTCRNNTFGSDCRYLQISHTLSTPKRYISVDNGVQGASSANQFDLYDSAISNKSYQVTFKKSASGKYLMLWATDTGTMTGKVKDNNTDTTWEDIV